MSEQQCASASGSHGKTYWCGEPPPVPAPTPRPPIDEPMWQPGMGICSIGVCGCGWHTGEYSFCNEHCPKTAFDDSDGSRQFCPSGTKSTKMTNYCHLSKYNCEQDCNGHYCGEGAALLQSRKVVTSP